MVRAARRFTPSGGPLLITCWPASPFYAYEGLPHDTHSSSKYGTRLFDRIFFHNYCTSFSWVYLQTVTSVTYSPESRKHQADVIAGRIGQALLNPQISLGGFDAGMPEG